MHRLSILAILLALAGCDRHAPFCEVTRNYESQLEIEVGSERFVSSVITEEVNRSFLYAEILDDNGCAPGHGVAHVFVLADRRALLIPARLPCYDAIEALDANGETDIASLCFRNQKPSPYPSRASGFIIDNVDRPMHWTGFHFDDGEIRLRAFTAASSGEAPRDDLDEIAPELVAAEYEGRWGPRDDAPSNILLRHRRLAQGVRHTITVRE